MKSVTLVLAFLVCIPASLTYKDVVLMHGILAGPWEFDFLKGLILQHHPGTKVHVVDMYNRLSSIEGLWMQANDIADKLSPILTNSSSNGTVLISFSQGGIVCRGILSLLEHNVETFISLSGPLAGQYGDTDYLKYFFPQLVKRNLYKILYTDAGQDISVGNYWRDPHHMDLYKNSSQYLAVLNNETTRANPKSQEYRSNFLRIKNLVLVGGPNDGVITPWQSSHFGTYDQDEVVRPMYEQEWYKNDAFGLQTLDKAGAIHIYTHANISHYYWHYNKEIFEKFILPWL